jgi:hypothetical protein
VVFLVLIWIVVGLVMVVVVLIVVILDLVMVIMVVVVVVAIVIITFTHLKPYKCISAIVSRFLTNLAHSHPHLLACICIYASIQTSS